jgi:hypothetical protein
VDGLGFIDAQLLGKAFGCFARDAGGAVGGTVAKSYLISWGPCSHGILFFKISLRYPMFRRLSSIAVASIRNVRYRTKSTGNAASDWHLYDQ